MVAFYLPPLRVNWRALVAKSIYESPLNGILQQLSKNLQKPWDISKNIRQKSVDMGLILEKDMGGWVCFSTFGPHTPVTHTPDKYLPRVLDTQNFVRKIRTIWALPSSRALFLNYSWYLEIWA